MKGARRRGLEEGGWKKWLEKKGLDEGGWMKGAG